MAYTYPFHDADDWSAYFWRWRIPFGDELIERCPHCLNPLEVDGCPVCDSAPTADLTADLSDDEPLFLPDELESAEFDQDEPPEWAGEHDNDPLIPYVLP